MEKFVSNPICVAPRSHFAMLLCGPDGSALCAEQVRRCAGSGMLRACRGDDGPRFDMKPVRASSRMLASTSGMPVSPAIQRSSAAWAHAAPVLLLLCRLLAQVRIYRTVNYSAYVLDRSAFAQDPLSISLPARTASARDSHMQYKRVLEYLSRYGIR